MDELAHHIDQRLHHRLHDGIAGRPRQEDVKFQMRVGAGEEVLAPHRFRRHREVGVKFLDVRRRLSLAGDPDDGRFRNGCALR